MLLIVHPMKEGTYTKSSGYGPRWGTHHNGVDFAAPIGTPIYAAADGVVVEGKDRTGVSGFGSWIWINCRDSTGVDLIYGHVQHSGILVRKGDRVTAGQQIGVVGNEGESTGPHLHFEVWRSPGRVGGVHIDPEPWLSGAGRPESVRGDMSTVIDFSASTPSARSIKAAGHSGVVRYISPARDAWMKAKPVTSAQVEDMKANGLDVACVWQYGGAASPDAMRGRAGGLSDARAAEDHLNMIGLKNWPVFFAVDFDISLQQWNQTAVKYFEAACEVLGRDRVGIYGHSRVLDWAREDGVVADLGGGKFLGWQAAARSWEQPRGHIHPGAVLHQSVPNVPGPEGIQIDINDVRHTYWGQSPRNTDKGESVTVQDNAVDIDLHHLIKFGRATSLPKKQIIVHTTENNPGTPSRNIVDYQVRSRSGSYHRLVDATGQITMANTDGWQVWATGNKGNDIALHVSCVTWAKSTREDWLNQPKMLEGVARTIAYWARTYGIPLVKLSREELGAGKHGVAGHLEAQVWGNTTHWDPGYHFPYDVVLARAKEINASGGAKPEPVPEPEPEVEPSIPSDHVVSLVNPRVHFPEKFALALIDRATWENHKMLKKLLEINKVDPDEFLAEEIRKDNEGA